MEQLKVIEFKSNGKESNHAASGPVKANRDDGGDDDSAASAPPDIHFGASCTPGGLAAEVLELWLGAWPIQLSMLVALGTNVVSQLFIGRLGLAELAASSLASSFQNITGSAVVLGLAGGIDTLAAQAFGAGRFRDVGLALQRGFLVVCVACVPVIAIWVASGPLLVALGQDPAIAGLSQTYLRLQIPGLLCLCFSQCVDKWLIAQGVMAPLLAVALLRLVAHAALLTAVLSLGGGFVGAACAGSASALVEAVATAGLGVYHARFVSPRTWTPLSGAALAGWGGYLAVALPSMLMLVAEWSSMEVLLLLAGLLPPPTGENGLVLDGDAGAAGGAGALEGANVAAMGIVFSLIYIAISFPIGWATALGSRVGRALGATAPPSFK